MTEGANANRRGRFLPAMEPDRVKKNPAARRESYKRVNAI
jgi:hypothetical protein